MDPFELLKTDHRKVEQLFSQLESANGKRKLEVFKQIKTELELHTQIEEKIFYPALEEPEETHDLALEAYEEHAKTIRQSQDCERRVGGAGQGVAGKCGTPRRGRGKRTLCKRPGGDR